MMKHRLSIILFFAGILSVFAVIVPALSVLLQKDIPIESSHSAGYRLYNEKCALCHLSDGTGIAQYNPPIRNSDYLADKKKVIEILLFGMSKTMIVNGLPYSGAMNPVRGTDQEIASIINYVYEEFGGQASSVTSSQISEMRKKAREAIKNEMNQK